MANHAHRRRWTPPTRRQLAVSGGVVAVLAAALVGPQFGSIQTAMADPADGGPTTTTTAPPPPPPLQPLPVQVYAAAPTRPRYRVAVPGWAGAGELLTNGADAPLIKPGQLGRSVLVVPTVPTGPQIQVESDLWRVFRSGQLAEGDLAGALDASPKVPTVLLISGSGDPRSFVEAR